MQKLCRVLLKHSYKVEKKVNKSVEQERTLDNVQ